MQIRVRPETVFCFDIRLSYLAPVSSSMRQCVVYIHDPERTLIKPLTSDLIYMVLRCLPVQHVTSFCFDIGIYYLAHGSIFMRRCVKYIYDPHTTRTLTFYLKVKFIGFLTCGSQLFFLSFVKVIHVQNFVQECFPIA